MLKIKKNGQRAWVTFSFFPSQGEQSVVVSGEWSDWKDEPMKQKKSGEFSMTKILKVGSQFQFGYKINSQDWILEENCPSIVSSLGTNNSLLEL